MHCSTRPQSKGVINGVKIPFITGEKFQHKDKAYENKLTDLIKKHKTTISELYDELIDNSITLDFFIFKLFETTNQKYAMEHLKLKDTPIIKRKRVKKH